MTTTAGTPQAQQPPPPQEPPTEAAILAALTVILLATQPIAGATAQVQNLLGALSISPDAAKLAAGLAFTEPATYAVGGVASASVRRTGMPRRAAYILSAARRLTAGGTIEAERRYLGQHRDAERSRVEAARRVDVVAAEHGPVLGWRARMDDITTRACRAAHRHNFRADHPPLLPKLEEGHQLVGYPGTLHGGSCRCVPGPPYAGAILLD